VKLVYVLLNIAGADQRQDDLFSTESLLAKGRSALKGLKVREIQIQGYNLMFSTMAGC
jgi:hypothetical protein